MKNQTSKYSYNYLLFLVVLYMTTFPLIGISFQKPVDIGWLHVRASTLIYPLTFFFADIVTEVYGYQVMRQLIWCQLPGTIYYQAILMSVVYDIHAPATWHYQAAYDYVFKGMGVVGFLGDFGIIIAFFMNSYLISKWKILLKGKFFWLRSIGASVLGESLQLFIGMFGTVVSGLLTSADAVILFINVILYRVAATAILAVPANAIAFFLKKIEGINVFDVGTNFTPFRISIDKNVKTSEVNNAKN